MEVEGYDLSRGPAINTDSYTGFGCISKRKKKDLLIKTHQGQLEGGEKEASTPPASAERELSVLVEEKGRRRSQNCWFHGRHCDAEHQELLPAGGPS